MAAAKASVLMPVLFLQCCDEAVGNQSTQQGVPVWVLCIMTMAHSVDTHFSPCCEGAQHFGNEFDKQVNIRAEELIFLKAP